MSGSTSSVEKLAEPPLLTWIVEAICSRDRGVSGTLGDCCELLSFARCDPKMAAVSDMALSGSYPRHSQGETSR
jgi:hypothetical protein